MGPEPASAERPLRPLPRPRPVTTNALPGVRRGVLSRGVARPVPWRDHRLAAMANETCFSCNETRSEQTRLGRGRSGLLGAASLRCAERASSTGSRWWEPPRRPPQLRGGRTLSQGAGHAAPAGKGPSVLSCADQRMCFGSLSFFFKKGIKSTADRCLAFGHVLGSRRFAGTPCESLDKTLPRVPQRLGGWHGGNGTVRPACSAVVPDAWRVTAAHRSQGTPR